MLTTKRDVRTLIREIKSHFDIDNVIERAHRLRALDEMKKKGWLVLSYQTDKRIDEEATMSICTIRMRCIYIGKRKVLDEKLCNGLKRSHEDFKKNRQFILP